MRRNFEDLLELASELVPSCEIWKGVNGFLYCMLYLICASQTSCAGFDTRQRKIVAMPVPRTFARPELGRAKVRR